MMDYKQLFHSLKNLHFELPCRLDEMVSCQRFPTLELEGEMSSKNETRFLDVGSFVSEGWGEVWGMYHE